MPAFQKPRSFLKTILWAGLLVGTLDISAAIVNYLVVGGKNPLNIFVFIASGVFGKDAFMAGTPMALWGFLFHYFIAYSWTTFFLLLYPRAGFLARSWVATGIGYGVFIWLVMNQIVLPLSNTPKGSFNLTSALIGMAILVAMIGLPLSWIAKISYHPK